MSLPLERGFAKSCEALSNKTITRVRLALFIRESFPLSSAEWTPPWRRLFGARDCV